MATMQQYQQNLGLLPLSVKSYKAHHKKFTKSRQKQFFTRLFNTYAPKLLKL